MNDQVTIFEPHGFVRLVKWMGTELDIVNAARVSLAKQSDWKESPVWLNDTQDDANDGEGLYAYGSLEDTDAGLLNFLMRERHGTPFEMGFIAQWHVRAPMSVFYEWHRHRVGHSFNEESGRYVELRPDFYTPERQHVRSQTGKPGAYSFTPINDEGVIDYTLNAFERCYFLCYHEYQQMLTKGVAKELARQVLPVGLYKEMRVVTNARSLMAFLSLRADPNAMFEIRRYAEEMETIFERYMPNVVKGFRTHGRMAP